MSASKSVPHPDAAVAGVRGIHHLEMYVSDARRAAGFYRTVLGFEAIDLDGRVAPSADRTTVAMQRGRVRLLLTAPATSDGEVAEHIRRHGDGIKDIAFVVDDVDALFERATARGARPLHAPSTLLGETGSARFAIIGVCGDVAHSLYDRAPAPSRRTSSRPPLDTALDGIDHVAFALEAGELDRWVEFYVSALGFEETHQEQVSTEYSAMRSKVVATTNGAVRFPLMEPAPGKRQSQIEAYVQSHGGPGAQHLAFSSHDIVKSVSAMRAGLEFLPTPAPYYDSLPGRVGSLPADMEALQRHGILVDRDSAGLLLQVFTKPVGERPTLFFEVIERRNGARGFGSGNIRALFEAVERMQAAQGAL